ncbi:MAG: hypothetical protein R3E96_00875 [Planctomycetota bacterium]
MKIAAFLLLCAPVLGQGDSCSNPQVISGEGTWAYDAIPEASPPLGGDESCAAWVYLPPEADWYYFEWTATTAGNFRFTVQNPQHYYPRGMRLYWGGGCSQICAASLALETGSYSYLELVNVVPGETYLLQLLHFRDYGNGMNLSVASVADPCAAMGNDPLEPNDVPSQAYLLPLGTFTGLKTDALNRDLFAWQVPPQKRLEVSDFTSPTSMDFFTYSVDGTFLGQHEFGAVYLNRTNQVQTVVVEPVNDYGIPDRCSEYDFTAMLVDVPCALPENPFPGQGTFADPYPLTDGTHLGLYHFNAGHPGNLPAGQIYSCCMFPGGRLDVELRHDPAMGSIRLGLVEMGPAFVHNDFYSNGPPVVSVDTVGGVAQLSWVHNGPEPRAYLFSTYGDCGQYDLIVQGAVNCRDMVVVGNTVCGGFSQNSSGAAATLVGYGSELWQSNAIWLHAQGLPPGSPAMIVGGRGLQPGTLPGTLGNFCLWGQPFNRYFETFNGTHSGDFETWVDLYLAGPSRIPALVGETWTFQCWYRDQNGSSTANLSTALRMTLE